MSSKTYAQAAAWPSGYDETWEPLVEPMPKRRPRAISIAEAARMAMRSQPRQQLVQQSRQRRIMHVDGAVVHSDDAGPVQCRSKPTYAEVAQQPGEQASPSYNDFGNRSLFTSTENSLGLPNQIIYTAAQQPPHRTSRMPMLQVAPYRVPHMRQTMQQEVYIPTLAQPEHNLDPRDPRTLIQRTGRGGHRQPVSSNLSSSGTSSPLSCGTLSTTSAASRARRKGSAMKDPALPYKCSECGNTYLLEDYLV